MTDMTKKEWRKPELKKMQAGGAENSPGSGPDGQSPSDDS